ncbi:sulfite exporter TauE/SafE family protein [Candidatus Uhrbacteria bacterium]|nr:sulfite exporter TauE/SafE family protein [Candidatus Uhrbacteria bacterium]
MTDGTLILAFTAGLVSFLSPCILPIIPGFLAYLAGSSTAGSQSPRERFHIFLASVAFVFGFSSVFASLGVLLNTILERVAYDTQEWMARFGGVIIILFGLYLTGLVKLPFLEREHTLKVTHASRYRLITSFLFGAAFAAGWTPCVGAVLGSILAIATTKPGTAFGLLFTYSLGLGIPFLLVGLSVAQAQKIINRFTYLLKPINIIFGVVLIVLGVFVFTNRLSLIANLDLLNQILLK